MLLIATWAWNVTMMDDDIVMWLLAKLNYRELRIYDQFEKAHRYEDLNGSICSLEK